MPTIMIDRGSEDAFNAQYTHAHATIIKRWRFDLVGNVVDGIIKVNQR